MAHALQWLRSLVFVGQMYAMMAVIALVFTPFAIFSRRAAYAAMHLYCRWVRWSAGWMVGLRSEIRGAVPAGEVLVAAKHQSFFDIILIFGALPRGKFIMKKELWCLAATSTSPAGGVPRISERRPTIQPAVQRTQRQ